LVIADKYSFRFDKSFIVLIKISSISSISCNVRFAAASLNGDHNLSLAFNSGVCAGIGNNSVPSGISNARSMRWSAIPQHNGDLFLRESFGFGKFS
jgi:hypothetical protein